jgi:hypothetical protein
VHVRDGAITGARADVTRHELSRRLLGTGLVDDEALASAAEALTADASLSLAQLLVERAALDADRARAVAVDQITDAVFSLQRWTVVSSPSSSTSWTRTTSGPASRSPTWWPRASDG